MKIITKEDFKNFINALIKDDAWNVIGAKSHGTKFAFGPLESAEDLRLDYDVTLLPPKKYFFPQRETLFTYDLDGFSTKNPEETKPMVIVGVHPYDIVALLHMDEIFRETKSDLTYFKKRETSVIIGVNIQKMSKWNFSSVMGCSVIDYGYDLMLTDLGNRYGINVGSSKGEALLLKYAKNVTPALARDIQIAGQKKRETMNMGQQKLDFSAELIPELLKESYGKSGFWENHSEKCLACGSCVLVCPTCYCFDVKDNTDLTLEHGERIRTWDGCLLEDFAKIASGENFRATRPTRYRHRYFKKGKYLFDKFGFISCVGCGRCSSNCLPDIANPVNLFNDMYRERQNDGLQTLSSATQPDVTINTEGNIDYVPKLGTIIKKIPMTTYETLFEIKIDDGSELDHKPGQFVEVSVFGIGEAPISLSSSPTRSKTFELCVRKLGNVTSSLHKLSVGSKVGIRGPFGNGFDANSLKGKDLLFIAGGLGIAPLRSLFNFVLDNRKDYGKVTLLYGCKEPRELLFGDELASLASRDDIEFKSTVNWCPENDVWSGNIGVITTLIPQVEFDSEKTIAILCGPPVMYKFVIADLKNRNVPDENIIMSLERRMKCGVGKCGHCQINQIYVCRDGPVFNYSKIKGVPEAL